MSGPSALALLPPIFNTVYFPAWRAVAALAEEDATEPVAETTTAGPEPVDASEEGARSEAVGVDVDADAADEPVADDEASAAVGK